MIGYLRQDGRKGIRNYVLVTYLVECAHHVARAIATPFEEDGAQLIGFPGCYPHAYAQGMMEALCTHPNVGAVLVVSLGCEQFNRPRLLETIEASGRPCKLLVIQKSGGTRATIQAGREWLQEALDAIGGVARVPVGVADLVIGTECGGSDATSGLTANPAIGIACDHVIDAGGTAMFEELGELFGCEQHMVARATSPALGQEIMAAMAKAQRHYAALEQSSFGGGNITGGLSTIEEKSIGAYSKSGTRPIVGMLRPGTRPTRPGLYLMDMVPDDEVKWGFANINDNATITEQIACGWVGGRLGGRAGDQGLRQPRDLPAPGGGHGRGCRAHPGGPRHAGRGRRRAVVADQGGRRRRPDQVGGARPSGIHSRLQDVRAARAQLPAGLSE